MGRVGTFPVDLNDDGRRRKEVSRTNDDQRALFDADEASRDEPVTSDSRGVEFLLERFRFGGGNHLITTGSAAFAGLEEI